MAAEAEFPESNEAACDLLAHLLSARAITRLRLHCRAVAQATTRMATGIVFLPAAAPACRKSPAQGEGLFGQSRGLGQAWNNGVTS
jgi:hypothetical protein